MVHIHTIRYYRQAYRFRLLFSDTSVTAQTRHITPLCVTVYSPMENVFRPTAPPCHPAWISLYTRVYICVCGYNNIHNMHCAACARCECMCGVVWVCGCMCVYMCESAIKRTSDKWPKSCECVCSVRASARSQTRSMASGSSENPFPPSAPLSQSSRPRRPPATHLLGRAATVAAADVPSTVTHPPTTTP